MKHCPICDTGYPDEHTTCPGDGAVLLEIREWAPGTVIRSKYRILAILGRGGMGTVYKAEHLALEEVRALKVMATHLASDPTFARRFRQEAQAARRLRHPNTVHVDDFEQAEDGSLFIAMEYVDGVSLRDLLRATKGPLSLPQALGIARGVAEGLGAAHALGMVHRDIKPENILLERDAQGRDVPKIGDFGIVAIKEGSTTLSQSPLMTPPYASPEQWKGMKANELDGRADLYALGITLYEMLTGRLPFTAETPEGWPHAHLNEPVPPPSQFNKELESRPGVDRVVLQLLEKDRERRPRDAQELIELLNGAESQASWDKETIPHPQPKPQPIPQPAKSAITPSPSVLSTVGRFGRVILAIMVGYLVQGIVPSIVIISLQTGHGYNYPYNETNLTNLQLFTVSALIICFALPAGYLTVAVSGRRDLKAVVGLAIWNGIGALLSALVVLFVRATGNDGKVSVLQLALFLVVFLEIPILILGGRLRLRKRREPTL